MSITRLPALVAFVAGAMCHVPIAHAQTLTTLYSFKGPPDAASPRSGVIYVNGTLYGTTFEGGVSNYGTVFKLDVSSRVETVLHSFDGGPTGEYPTAGVIYNDGTLYGATSQKVFSIDPATGNLVVLYTFPLDAVDGAYPLGLICVGALYGTTNQGGTGGLGFGTVFKVKRDTGAATVLHNFGYNDAAYPNAGLSYNDGNLYGTTQGGGASGDGTVYSINAKTGAENVLYSFSNGPADGAYPDSVPLYHDGNFYGTATGGGATYNGTVFALNPTTGVETILHSFMSGADGAFPAAGVIYEGGTLFGTTEYGGTSSFGTVFAVNPTTGAESVLHSFTGRPKEGRYPLAALTHHGGVFFGTTNEGGVYGYGTVFRLDQ